MKMTNTQYKIDKMEKREKIKTAHAGSSISAAIIDISCIARCLQCWLGSTRQKKNRHISHMKQLTALHTRIDVFWNIRTETEILSTHFKHNEI